MNSARVGIAKKAGEDLLWAFDFTRLAFGENGFKNFCQTGWHLPKDL